MIGLPDHKVSGGTPIYLCTDPVDFRKGFDGLTGIVTTSLGKSVTDGSLFLFVNRKRDRIKALWWETGGLTLWYRRLEQGTVELPKPPIDQSHVAIDSVELAMWIAGVSLKSAKTRRKRMKVA
ncbi:IS66 family insertion sequence element accessory protein TnpB [Rhodopirellula bahusiensis]|uniref:IS66 family insertion sequence element accessory protein TnpB n=1 Tax=Rhodopirellula bahusiensis TaxID=2014065 RepID=UPI003266D247